MLAVLLVSGVFIADQYLRLGEVQASIFGGDTQQAIWDGGNDLDNWNCRSATNPVANRIRLDSNTTHAAYCLLKTPIDISVVSGKSLGVAMIWYLVSNPGTYPSELGWYFTRNATAPTEIADYAPATDDNVGMVVRHSDGGAGVESGVLFIQKDTGLDVVSGDPGGCSTGGTVFICDDGSLPDDTTEASYSELRLNFTGNVGSASSTSYLWIGETALPPNFAQATITEVLPWLQFQGQQYYLGIYVRARTPDPVAVEWLFSDVEVFLSTPLPSSPETPTQRIDTGGFFGPVIRALINVGLLVFEQISRFLGWVADLFIDAMDAVGIFFRLGAIGTAIRDALTGTANFIVNVFAVTVGWAVTLASLFQNVVGFFTQFFSGSNPFVAFLISFFGWIPNIWTLVAGVWDEFLRWYNLGVFSIGAIMMVWWTFGEYQVYMDGLSGLRSWLSLTETFTVKIVKGGYWLGKEMFQVVLDVKRLLAQWI